MNYTQQDILDRIASRVDYAELARLLELDLNTIAQEVVLTPEEFIEFKVFFDFGEFDTTVKTQSVGEGQGFNTTPVLLSLIGGNYSTSKGPQIFQTHFRIETLGFTKDLENLRAILEVYSSLNQGAITNGFYSPNALTTSITDFPVFSESFQYKGFDRISGFLSWNLSFIYSGQLSNDVVITLDSEPIQLLSLDIKRNRITSSTQPNDSEETSTLNESQVLTFTGVMIYDGTEVSKKVLRNIKNKGHALNEIFNLEITYPTILENEAAEVDQYDIVVTEGDVQIIQGSYLTLSFSMTLA